MKIAAPSAEELAERGVGVEKPKAKAKPRAKKTAGAGMGAEVSKPTLRQNKPEK